MNLFSPLQPGLLIPNTGPNAFTLMLHTLISKMADEDNGIMADGV
jgi:hypothetical protein